MTTKLKRIDPASIPDLYREISLKPCQFTWDVRPLKDGRYELRKVCLSYALLARAVGPAIERHLGGVAGCRAVTRMNAVARETGFTLSYLVGLVNGWDACGGTDPPPITEADRDEGLIDSEFLTGFADGAAAYKAVASAGLFEETS